MMRRLLTSSIIMAAVSLEATAIDANGAKQAAANVFQELHGSNAVCGEMQIVACDSLHLSPTYYVCQPSDAPGYFIISAIEGTPELIAYSETDSYEHQSLPLPFRDLLTEYSMHLERRASMQMAETEPAGSTPNRSAEQKNASTINPLIKTYWAQGSPYNRLCPESDGQHTLTGCNATAMAQVFNYHQYPSVATGTGTATLENQQLASIDLSEYPLQWDLMLDTYQGVEYSEEQANAVATLMKVCGYSINMDYRLDYSGAYIEHTRQALVENFGYSPQARLYLRDSYEKSNYLALIRSELEAGRPIIVGGLFTVSKSGHTFICDGYGVRDKIHINWGWGEDRNNMVDLDFLAPNGYNESYNRDLKMLMGIQPISEGESNTLPYNLSICDSLKFKPSSKMYIIPSVYNLCPSHINLNFGFCIRQGDEVVQYIDLNKNITINFLGHSNPIYGILSLPSLADGEYSLQMVVRPFNSTDWMAVSPGDRTDAFTFTISEGEMTFGQYAAIKPIEADPIQSVIQQVDYSLSGTPLGSGASPRGFSVRNGKVIFVR